MNKKIIIIVAVILGLGIIGFIGNSIVNSRIEDEITSTLDEQIKENGFSESFKFEEVSTSVIDGSMELSNIEYFEDGTNLKIESIEISMPHSNALELAKDPNNATITDININLEGIELSNDFDEITINQDSLSAQFKGSINTKIFSSGETPTDSDFKVTLIEMDNQDLVLTTPIGIMEFDNLSFNIEGDITATDLEKDYDEIGYGALIKLFDSFSLNFENYKYEAQQDIRQGLTMMAYMFLGDSSFIGNQENWAIEKLSIHTENNDNTLVVENLDIVTNWIDLGLNASITYDDYLDELTPFSAKLSMNDYIKELRPFFETFAAEVSDETLPEGSFLFNLNVESPDSIPEVSIEKL